MFDLKKRGGRAFRPSLMSAAILWWWCDTALADLMVYANLEMYLIKFVCLFQRRRSTAETSLFMPSLPLPSDTLLHRELPMPRLLTWVHPQHCTPTSPVTAARDALLEPASSVRCVQTTTCAPPARLKGSTPSTLCCPSGTPCR